MYICLRNITFICSANVVAGKVNSPYESVENQEKDSKLNWFEMLLKKYTCTCNIQKFSFLLFFVAHFIQVIKRANLEPTKKYTVPQTESQEIGWITRPLVRTTTINLLIFMLLLQHSDFHFVRLTLIEMINGCIFQRPVVKSQNLWTPTGDSKNKPL